MRDFRQLKVWEKAHQLVLDIYDASGSFPRDEMFGLTSQIRRAAASIPANIAEGSGTASDAELARYLQMAMSSSSEVDYHLLLAKDLGMLRLPDYERLRAQLTEVQRMLATFIRRLREQSSRQVRRLAANL